MGLVKLHLRGPGLNEYYRVNATPTPEIHNLGAMGGLEEPGSMASRRRDSGWKVDGLPDSSESSTCALTKTAKAERLMSSALEDEGGPMVPSGKEPEINGRPALQSSLWGYNGPGESAGTAPTAITVCAPTEAPPVSISRVKSRSLKRCPILAHRHGPLVTLQAVECLGAELGLLARVPRSDVEAIVTAVCELASVPAVPVEFVWAPNRKPRNHLGWYCGHTPLPLFQYPAQIVLNRANGGNTLITLAHELAHHVVVRRIIEKDTYPARRYRPHVRPFPGTYREMVGYVHAYVETEWRSRMTSLSDSCD